MKRNAVVAAIAALGVGGCTGLLGDFQSNSDLTDGSVMVDGEAGTGGPTGDAAQGADANPTVDSTAPGSDSAFTPDRGAGDVEGDGAKGGGGEAGSDGAGEAGGGGAGEAGSDGAGDAGRDGAGDARSDGAGEAGSDGAGEAGSDGAVEASTVAPGAPSSVTAAAVPVVSTVTTLAGSGVASSIDGVGAAATFSDPRGLAIDAAGNLYVADSNRIRKVTPAGAVTTFAGSATSGALDGRGTAATFGNPMGLALDAAGNIYVGDATNQIIRKVTPAGDVTTLAGTAGVQGSANGMGAAASFFGPGDVAADAIGNVYVSDSVNHRIRLASPPAPYAVITIAGSGQGFADGTGAAANFNFPGGLAVNAGGFVTLCDSNNDVIRKITPSGVVTTLAGSAGVRGAADGIGMAATFASPQGVALDAAGNAYISDHDNHKIRVMTPAGVVTTLAGSGVPAFLDGPAGTAQFANPTDIAVDAARNVYVTDSNNNRLRKITTAGIRQLVAMWSPPTAPGTSPITAYAATASAAGYAPQTCTTAGATSCTIGGLTSGVAYGVSVTATSAAGTSPPSASATATPN